MPTEVKPDGTTIDYSDNSASDSKSSTASDSDNNTGIEPTKTNKTLKFTDANSYDEPLIIVNNPFKKILKWLYDIRKRQTTKFSINLNIPLLPFVTAVGLAIAIILVFTFGTGLKIGEITITRALLLQPTPTPVFIRVPSPSPVPFELSKIGIVKSTFQYKLPTSTPTADNASTISGQITVNPEQPIRFILMEPNGSYYLLLSSNVDYAKFNNERVLITGIYNPATNVISVSTLSDIEILP